VKVAIDGDVAEQANGRENQEIPGGEQGGGAAGPG
jgi:hypothetical protein